MMKVRFEESIPRALALILLRPRGIRKETHPAVGVILTKTRGVRENGTMGVVNRADIG